MGESTLICDDGVTSSAGHNATCKACGETFYSKPFKSTDRVRKMCPKCIGRSLHPPDGWSEPRPCKGCKSDFVPIESKTRLYCSKACRLRFVQRTEGKLRKALRRNIEAAGEAIDWLIVMERDKWRCHICGRRTLKRLRGKQEPLSPELDHIVPVALGGNHTYDNCACSCHECNHKKKDKPLGQLSIFGNAFIPSKDGLSHRDRTYRDMRNIRDVKIITAIEELVARGEIPFIADVAQASGLPQTTIQKALRWKSRGRIKPPWADMIRIMTPEECGDKARKLFSRPKSEPPDVRCKTCNTAFRKAGDGRTLICNDCKDTTRLAAERVKPEPRQCAICPNIFIPRNNSPGHRFCSERCRARDEQRRRRARHRKHSTVPDQRQARFLP